MGPVVFGSPSWDRIRLDEATTKSKAARMMFDTDVLIWALRGNLRAARAIDVCPDRTLSVVSFMELIQGTRSKQEARQIGQSLRKLRFRSLPLSEAIGTAATAIVEKHTFAHGVQLADALIAATAIEADKQLCTGIIRHFRAIEGLTRVAFRP